MNSREIQELQELYSEVYVDEKINLTTQSSKRKSLGKYKGEYESPKEFRKTEIKDAPYQSKGNYNAHLSKEEFDLFDVVLEHLLAEGYADTEQAAEAIMVNMSEEWRVSIVEEVLGESRGGAASPGTPESYHELSRGVKKNKGQKTSYDSEGNMIRKYATMQLKKRKQPPYNN